MFCCFVTQPMNNMDFVSTFQWELLFLEQKYFLKTLVIQPQNPYVSIYNKLVFKRWRAQKYTINKDLKSLMKMGV